MSFCKDCVVAVTHEGTPTGKIEQIGGVNTYVALPEGDYPKDKAVLFLTDIFGITFQSNQLLVERWLAHSEAEAGGGGDGLGGQGLHGGVQYPPAYKELHPPGEQHYLFDLLWQSG